MSMNDTFSFVTELAHPYNKVGDGPENPEVRIVADQIRNKVVGKKILSISKTEKSKVTGFDKMIYPATMTIIRSHGKKIIIELDTNIAIVIALGMAGRFVYEKLKHCHVCLDVEDDIKLYFDHSRPIAIHFDIIDITELPTYFKKIGPDLLEHALTTPISSEQWLKIYKNIKSKKKVCNVLIDQSLVSGIGWYIMVETLYYARVHPERLWKDVTDEDWENIRIHSHDIVKRSYESNGLTIRSYISPDGNIGRFEKVIYKQDVDPCGNKIVHKKTGKDGKSGRTLHFVPELQT
jgi:formamidopyrimidine-DNA glycosylase